MYSTFPLSNMLVMSSLYKSIAQKATKNISFLFMILFDERYFVRYMYVHTVYVWSVNCALFVDVFILAPYIRFLACVLSSALNPFIYLFAFKQYCNSEPRILPHVFLFWIISSLLCGFFSADVEPCIFFLSIRLFFFFFHGYLSDLRLFPPSLSCLSLSLFVFDFI